MAQPGSMQDPANIKNPPNPAPYQPRDRQPKEGTAAPAGTADGHVEVIGEVDNERSDEDKAPILSDERYKR
ncbi:hypothetical protein SAMN06265795_101131 [Noviherbaspirillum humi]|uniref:Uncharacterized protein n=1 Tax=Noviherbaspirillum humi TaxID=1688639 RepID=A0A239BWE8_9BURK|nr:hypothetical protein [Noviherbaspirillum humi]SNS12337.1 hypothetical protein SAMN06265795_101131 [Noviherbaspirillum humi]